MRDIQTSIASYYRCSTGFVDAERLATPVRACVAFIQVVNDVLRNDFSQQALYRSLFELPHDPRVEILQAFQYVRNVGQHLIHPVAPDAAHAVGGIGLGYRTYARWQEIPLNVHARLHSGTQALKVYYDTHLLGKEVTTTFLAAARVFWEICPDSVDRRPNGEWTAFPLRHQPGVDLRLHPEEPEDRYAALQWMARRKPGGDSRVICGCLQESTGDVVFGLTFSGHCAFTPFFETPGQVRADAALGFPYFIGNVVTNTHWVDHLCDVGGEFPPALCSTDPVEQWVGAPISDPSVGDEWTTFETPDYWRSLFALEGADHPGWFATRRERRLNAWFPII